MKNFLKITLIILTLAGTCVIGAALYVLNRLPSVQSIASGIGKKSEPSTKVSSQNTVVQTSTDITVSSISADNTPVAEAVTPQGKSPINQALMDDLTSPQKPLSDFCGSLKNAKNGSFSQKEFGQAFSDSIDSEKQDPRVQAFKPMLRYVMRLPQVTEMIAEVDAAVERKDESFLKKAEFYSKALSAFSEMKEHKSDIESVMDRSYLLLGLNKLVAHNPSLLNDPRVRNYCDTVELAFNQNSPVTYDQEKNDFLRFLSDVGVSSKEIGFNENYKSAIDLKFSGQMLTFEGGWLSDLISTDTNIKTDVR